MKTSHRRERRLVNRSLLLGGIVFLVLLLYKSCVAPVVSGLDEPTHDVLVAAAVSAAAWWLVFRVWRF